MKHAIRQLVKNPGFTVVALATLALGIGVNTTAFTVLNRLILRSLPFRDANRLVQIWTVRPHQAPSYQAPGEYFDEREQNTVFEEIAAYSPFSRWSFSEPGQPPLQYGVTPVTASFFSLFGLHPQLGRTFTADEERRMEPVVVVSNSFWRDHYNADARILGRTVKLNSKVYTIVGVMSPALDDPTLFGKMAFWALDPTQVNRKLHGGGWYTVTARLKPGVTIEQAQAEVTAIARRIEHDNPKTNQGYGLQMLPYPTGFLLGAPAQLTWLVLVLSGLVLLIACANLANLQLVRAMRRSHELGVRIALGCSRGSLVWMLLLESLVVSVAGGALGLIVAKWSNAYVAAFFDLDLPLDWRVLGFTFLVSLLTGAVFGVVPAWIASRTDVNATLKSGTRGATADRSRHWLRQGLVVTEVALALVLLAAAGFFVNGIFTLTHRSLGWNTNQQILVGYIELDHDHYGEQNDPRSLEFGERMVRNLAALPGVEAVSLGASPAWSFDGGSYRVEGKPAPEPGHEDYAGFETATPDFFKVCGIRLMQGRGFRDSDRPGSPNVVIVNEAMAAKCWPGENPLGKRIGATDPAAPAWAEVVGVMKDFECGSEFYDPTHNKLKVLRPWAQNNHRFISFNVRTAIDAETFKTTFRKSLGLLAPDIAPSLLITLKESLDGFVFYFSFLRRAMLQISGLGLLLAAVGIYGVVANLVSERTREIGIRMALGALPGDIVSLFLRNGARLALAGVAVGGGAAYFVLTLLRKMLPAIPGVSLWTLGGIAVALMIIAVIASWLPAKRTTKISPAIALRNE